MPTLLLMRHAKSSWDDPEVSDHDRPLNARGRRAAPRAAQWLHAQGLVPELIFTSTARRAFDTAHAVVTETGYDGRVEVTRRLYLAEPGAYIDVLGEVAPAVGRVLMVGHNPGISELVTLVTGEAVELPTAAIARVELPLPFSELLSKTPREVRGRLVDLMRPRELD